MHGLIRTGIAGILVILKLNNNRNVSEYVKSTSRGSKTVVAKMYTLRRSGIRSSVYHPSIFQSL